MTFIMTIVGFVIANFVYARFKDRNWDKAFEISFFQVAAVCMAWLNFSIANYFFH